MNDTSQPKSSIGDGVRFAFAFCWFHRRYFVGALLVAGVSWLIFYLSQTRVDDNIKEETSSTKSQIPTTQIDTAALNDPERTSSPISQELRNLSTNGSKQELIDSVIRSENIVIGRRSEATAIILSDRLKALQKLMTLELNDSEREFAVIAYIETLTILEWTNRESNLGLPNTRAALDEAIQIYEQDDNPFVASRANLADVIITGVEFLVSKTDANLDAFKQRYQTRKSAMMNDHGALMKLGEFIIIVTDLKDPESNSFQFAKQVIAELYRSPNPKTRTLAQRTEEKLYFGLIEFRTILERIAIDDRETRAEVNLLFDNLQVVTRTQPMAYSSAASCVRAYCRAGKPDVAEPLNEKLRLAAQRIEDNATQASVIQFCDLLDKEIAAVRKQTAK